LLAAALFIVGWQGVHQLRQLDREMREVIYDRWSEEQMVNEAFRLSNLNSRITLSVFLLDDADEINRLLVQRAANTEHISGLIRAIRPRLDTEKEKRLLAAVEAARKPYIESYLQALAKLVDEHQRDEARKMMAEVTLPRIAVYHAAWNAFTQCQVDEIEQAITQNKAHLAAAQRHLLFLVTLAGLIAVAIAGYVIFRVTREIAGRERVEEALRQSYDQLEQRIQQRTAELQQTNQALQAEITGRKQIEEELQRQKTELRVLFDWMPAMVCFKDTENRILRANKRIAEIVGKPVEEIEGKPIVEIFPQEAAKYYSDDLEVIHSGAPKLGIVETLRDREGKEQ
jgi:PAS domain S-box-containing protein